MHYQFQFKHKRLKNCWSVLELISQKTKPNIDLNKQIKSKVWKLSKNLKPVQAKSRT